MPTLNLFKSFMQLESTMSDKVAWQI